MPHLSAALQVAFDLSATCLMRIRKTVVTMVSRRETVFGGAAAGKRPIDRMSRPASIERVNTSTNAYNIKFLNASESVSCEWLPS